MKFDHLIIRGDARRIPLADRSVHCMITSPPFYGLRDYGVAGQIGLEGSPEAYVAAMVAVFREVWRVLRDDGCAWLNLGDSYAQKEIRHRNGHNSTLRDGNIRSDEPWMKGTHQTGRRLNHRLKPKDLIGIPWRVAFALQAEGWYLRSDIIWHKPNCMPESVTDRPTRSHEYLFLLAKRETYFYDAGAIQEPVVGTSDFSKPRPVKPMPSGQADGFNDKRILARLGNGSVGSPEGRNRRSVWTIDDSPMMLRKDLSPETRAHVISELLRRRIL